MVLFDYDCVHTNFYVAAVELILWLDLYLFNISFIWFSQVSWPTVSYDQVYLYFLQ